MPSVFQYKGAQLFKGDVKFVLGGSGHIAGVVNPPSANKYGYWTADSLPSTSEAWFKNAKKHEGSWWSDWQVWANKFTMGSMAARQIEDGPLKVIEPAPGSYVSKRIAEVI